MGEAQFRDLIARGAITPDTLVWSEGMSGWQRAGDVPGLMSGGPARRRCRNRASAGDGRGGGYGGAALTIDFGILGVVWRGLVLVLGICL